MPYKYTYSIQNDTLNSKIHLNKLEDEINNSSINTNFLHINQESDNIDIYFSQELISSEQTELTTLVNNHDGGYKNYKLYQYSCEDCLDHTIYPSHIIYDKETDIKLHKKDTMVKGDIINRKFYATYDGTNYSNLCVEEEITYTDNLFGDPYYQDKKIYYYYEDGSRDENYKHWPKWYDAVEGAKAGRRRRENIIAYLKQPLIGLIMQTEGDDLNTAAAKGIGFLLDYETAVNTWLDNPGTYSLQNKLALEVSGVTTHQWLFNDIGGGVTIKDYILNEVSY